MQTTPMVLVCTDRASRGIDSAHVEHVVLFDFPRDPSEYVRRAGRVSRGAGGTGLVSILALGRQVCPGSQRTGSARILLLVNDAFQGVKARRPMRGCCAMRYLSDQ